MHAHTLPHTHTHIFIYRERKNISQIPPQPKNKREEALQHWNVQLNEKLKYQTQFHHTL